MWIVVDARRSLVLFCRWRGVFFVVLLTGKLTHLRQHILHSLYTLFNGLCSFVGLIEPIPGKPDHLKLIWDRTLFSQRCEPVVRDDYLHLFYGRYMDPLQVRKAGFDLVEFKDDDNTTKTVVCALYETPMCDIGVRTKETIKGIVIQNLVWFL